MIEMSSNSINGFSFLLATDYWLLSTLNKRLRLVLCLVVAFWMCGCAAAPAPDPAGPRANEPPYPVLLVEDADRRETTLAEWRTLTRDQGIMDAPAPELQPVTATVHSIPTLAAPLYLPKVGEGTPMTEEETRESLRRFIEAASNLIGAEPRQLSLILRTDLADGTKKAEYRQRPFRNYPLRGDYGVLEISFAPDRRILQLTSTCIPAVDQLQRSGSGIRPLVTAEQVPQRIVGQTLAYTDQGGNRQTYTATTVDEITLRELVVYPRPRASDPTVLEFHLAWEALVGGEPRRVVHLDAITGEIIAVTQFNASSR
jgi:hypothetical protein